MFSKNKMDVKFKHFFRDKKITIMGLGILGRGLGVAKFLAECGAVLTITDLKTKDQLRASVAKLKKYKNINYALGKHRLSDFQNKDMIIKAAGVALDSPYIKEARKNQVPVEMDASLFAKLAPAKIIGVTGTRGKSTVTHLIYNCLKAADKKVFLSGNVKGVATLPLLKKIDDKDCVVVMELDSWQLQGFGEAKISPHIAVFTNFMPDHMNYYKGSMSRYFKDKANIFKFQNENDFLIAGEKARKALRKFFKGKINPVRNFHPVKGKISNIAKSDWEHISNGIKSKIIVAAANDVPKNWKIKIPGKYNLENIAAAKAALEAFGMDKRRIKMAAESFDGLAGRMEFIKEIRGVKYYNDTNATTPDAVIAGLETFKKYKGKIILIGGGADKGLDYKNYALAVKNYAKALILFKGAASDKIAAAVGKNSKLNIIVGVANMKDAIESAAKNATKRDIVALSPGAASFGVFQNEFDRGEQFVKAIAKLSFGKLLPHL